MTNLDLLPYEALIVSAAALLGGALLGLAARLGRFCALGAIEDAAFGADDGRARMWALALSAAMFAAFGLDVAGVVAIDRAVVLQASWNPFASVIGGLLFGYGMAMVGTCGFGALARLGGGDFRGLVVALVIGVVGYMSLKGPLAGIREAVFPTSDVLADGSPAGFSHWAAALSGASPVVFGLATAAAIATWALSDHRFRQRASMILWAIVAGGAIALGWAATGWASEHGFAAEAARSHSFVAPTGETLLYLMTSTAGGWPGFAVFSVSGLILGSAAGSLYRGEFRWEACDDARELRRQIGGAALMGVGGVLALGCTVGQGLTAFSVLAFSAPVVCASIVAGAYFGLSQLIAGAYRA